MQRRKFKQNKLWRDNVCKILIEEHDSVIHVKNLTDDQFKQELFAKLIEEAHEIVASVDKNELIAEIADLREVLSCIIKFHQISETEVEEYQTHKRQKFGGFSKRIFVTIAEHLPNSFGEKYCLNNQEKYPEII